MKLIWRMAISFFAPLFLGLAIIVSKLLFESWSRGGKERKMTFDGQYFSVFDQLFWIFLIGIVLLSVVLPILIWQRSRQNKTEKSTFSTISGISEQERKEMSV
ncbi:MAG: hypothetical protein ABI791_11435 [Acidobacteriota bacterium]